MKKNLGFFISLTILLWAFYRLLFQVDWLPIFRPLDLGSVFTFFVSSPKHLLLLSICISMLCLFIFWFGKELYIWFRLSKYGEHSLGTVIDTKEPFLSEVDGPTGLVVFYKFELLDGRFFFGRDRIPGDFRDAYKKGVQVCIRFDRYHPKVNKLEEPNFKTWGLPFR
jgi:hypothetical protein